MAQGSTRFQVTPSPPTRTVRSRLFIRIRPTSIVSNGLNPLTLLVLEPGVVQRSQGTSGSGIHVNGSRDRTFNVTIASFAKPATCNIDLRKYGLGG